MSATVTATHILLSPSDGSVLRKGKLKSFREVVDSASVASCLAKVSFCEVVDSAPQASFREVVDSACGNAREHVMNYAHSVPSPWLTISSFLPVTSTTSLQQQAREEGSS